MTLSAVSLTYKDQIHEVKSRISTTKAAFKKVTSFHQQIGLKFKVGTSAVLHLEHDLYGAEPWTLRKVDRMFCVFHASVLKSVIHFTLNQHMHIYKCVQSHVIILQQHVSALLWPSSGCRIL